MPQTKFVVSKALKIGLKPIVAVNKVDRPDARPQEVINEVFDLFAALDATDAQLDFPILYGSGRNGWMAASPEGPKDQGLAPLFDLVLSHVPQARDRGRAVPHARHAPGGEPVPRPHHHRPHRLGHRPPEPDHQGHRPRGPPRRERPRLEDPRLPRPRAPADRARRGRRHRLDRRAREGLGRRHLLRARGRDADPGAADRPADRHHVVHRQRSVRSPAPRATRSRAA